ncbi:MAG: hypothetical protein GX418_04655 [Clostridiales bacterium]|nr:hypothetical protein [Clostridiales bacterium]
MEIIADSRRLPPELLGLICRCRPHGAISPVTDTLLGAGLPEGCRIGLSGGRWAVLDNGVAMMSDRTGFAGSVVTPERCLRALWKEADLPLGTAVAMMTVDPCRVMGLERRAECLPRAWMPI